MVKSIYEIKGAYYHYIKEEGRFLDGVLRK